jgi:CRP-like cAMP-binding protein
MRHTKIEDNSQHGIQGEDKITLENDIELFILKNGIVTYADIVSRLKISDEYTTQAMKNLVSDEKLSDAKETLINPSMK